MHLKHGKKVVRVVLINFALPAEPARAESIEIRSELLFIFIFILSDQQPRKRRRGKAACTVVMRRRRREGGTHGII